MIDPIGRIAIGLPSGIASARSTPQASPGSFASMLQDLAGGTATTLADAERNAIGGIEGRVPVMQVVNSVMAAEQTLQTAIAIRDKAVAAYNEISHMAI